MYQVEEIPGTYEPGFYVGLGLGGSIHKVWTTIAAVWSMYPWIWLTSIRGQKRSFSG